MSARGCVVFAKTDGWQVALAPSDSVQVETLKQTEGATAAQAAGILKIWLSQRGVRNVPVLLALPSEALLSAAVVMEDLPRRQREAALKLRLEELLPLSAEEMSAAYVTTPEGALAVAAPLSRLSPLVAALRQQELDVRHVCSASLLAVQAVPEAILSQVRLLLWEDQGHLDFFRLAEGRPVEWAYLSDPRQDLLLRMAAQLNATKPLRVVGRCLSPAMRELLRQQPNVQMVQHHDEPLAKAAAETGLAVLAGTVRPWIDLRQTSVEAAAATPRQRMAVHVAAAALLLAALLAVAGLRVRAGRYQALAREAQQRQADVFMQEFPGQSPPLDIRARLRSELERLRQAAERVRSTPRPPSALVVLNDLLTALSGERWVSFQELAIDAGAVTLSGVTHSHADADGLAAELPTANLSVEPLRTRTLSNGLVDFRISAHYAPGASQRGMNP